MSPGVHGAFPSSRAEPLYFFSPPQIKHAEGKACPECCVVLFNKMKPEPVPTHGVVWRRRSESCWDSRGRKGLGPSTVPRGQKHPGPAG